MIHYESYDDLPFPVEVVWRSLRNTDWFNRALGLPPVKYEFSAKPEGGSSTRARARLGGIEIAWQELPFEWLEPEFYRVRRIFERGPLREASIRLQLHPLTGGTGVQITSEILPKNLLGKLLAEKIILPKTKHDIRALIAHLNAFLQGEKSVSLPRLKIQAVNESALKVGLDKLRIYGVPQEEIFHLEKFLRESPDVELTHIRPLAIAKKWKADPWKVLTLFLRATRSGLLDFRWEILCPNCRSSREELVNSLQGLKRTSHCDVCQIEFDAQFDTSVELKFTVNEAIRRRDEQTFCLAGPGGKPHVLSQIWLEPNQERSWKLPAFDRPMRLRSAQVKGSAALQPWELSDRRPAFILTKVSGFEIEYQSADQSQSSARIRNPNSFPVLVSLDQTAWSDDILTAARVTNWQDFRDLFAHEVISPEENISVGSQVILFTDLRGSTAMYHKLGDAPAYAVVRDHFTIVSDAVRRHHGTLVKTIGDAVMACFSRVDEALETVGEMNDNLQAFRLKRSIDDPLKLKASLHVGPCLAVNANDHLDYFGSTINLAARMVSSCQGGDLVVSDEIFQRPETAAFLKNRDVAPEPSDICFRGFTDPHRVWRIQVGAESP
ncbi:MAG TPA: DUF5939 domain-containing protein [Terrimicrobiaceae bacterium]